MRLRKNMKRTAAAVLALSMAVSAVAAPASAAYICDVSQGSVEVSVNEKGEKTIKVGDDSVTIKTDGTKETTGNGIKEDDDGTEDIVITGDNTKPTATESLNAEDENTSEVEKSGETKTEGKTQNSAAENKEQAEEPGSLELLAPEDEQKKTEEKKDEQKSADSQEPEQDKQTEKTSDQVIEYGQYDPEAQQEATKLVAKQETQEKKAAEEKTYGDTNAPTTLSEKAQATARNVVSIINNFTTPLKVILRDLKVDAGDTNKSAVTVSGSGNVTLELDGKNELTGGTGLKNYDIDRAGAGLRAEGKGTTTIEDKDGNGSLVATGGTLTVSDTMGKSTYAASGRGIDGAEIAGGNVIGKGGDIISDVSDSGGKFFGAGTGILTKKISGGIVEAIGGDVTGIDSKDGMIIVTAGQGLGGDGYANAYSGPIEISGGTVKATGGNVLIDRGLEEPYDGADGVHTANEVRVSGGMLIAQGGNTKDGDGGSGIGDATISGGTVVAVGGTGSETGGDGFGQYAKVKVTGGKVTAEGGKGKYYGVAVRNDKNVTGTVTKVESNHVHQYSEGDIVKEATCISEGYKLKKCNCGAEELERIAVDKEAHNWVENGHQDATCTKDGYTEYKCSACGATKHDNIISATGEHHFTVVKEVVAPTYTSEGYTIYKCETCDETEKRDVVPMLVPESNSASSGGSSAVTLTVTGAGAYETSIADGRYVVAVPAETAVLSGCLSNLKELKAQGVNTIVFRTQLRETVLNIDSMLSLGVDGTLFTLTHSGESAELTVGGVAHNELLH
ncbi:MAG: hypothetical protein ACLTS5_01700 [Faecalibacterium prausnitzii]